MNEHMIRTELTLDSATTRSTAHTTDGLCRRAFVSLGGSCPYRCHYCYTCHKQYEQLPEEPIDQLVANLADKEFDIVYISGHRESFVDPDQGLDLAEGIYESYRCDILITTRNVFNATQLDRLQELAGRMTSQGRDMFFCVSVPALGSYAKIEVAAVVPPPEARLDFLADVYRRGIYTYLAVRPAFPEALVPLTEVAEIIARGSSFSTAVISSGLVIEEKNPCWLKQGCGDFKVRRKAPLMKCLENNYEVYYVDVERELNYIEAQCMEAKVPFFRDSMSALRHTKSLSLV